MRHIKNSPMGRDETNRQAVRLRLNKETLKDLTVRTGAIKGGLTSGRHTLQRGC